MPPRRSPVSKKSLPRPQRQPHRRKKLTTGDTTVNKQKKPPPKRKCSPPKNAEIDNITATPIPEPLDHFTLFPKLPAELQLKVWGYASQSIAPRSLIVQSANIHLWFTETHRSSIIERYQARCLQPIPALIHTCHDSREVALKIYRPSFADRLNRPVYFNPSKDTLIMRDEDALESFVRALDPSLYALSDLLRHQPDCLASLIALKPVRDVRFLVLPKLPFGTVRLVSLFMDLEKITLQRRPGFVGQPKPYPRYRYRNDDDSILAFVVSSQWEDFQKENGGVKVEADLVFDFVQAPVMLDMVANAEFEGRLGKHCVWLGQAWDYAQH